MTELNANSAAVDPSGQQTGAGTRVWIGLVLLLGLAVVGLNATLFLLVRSNERGIELRESDIRGRLIEVEAREARRTSLDTEIRGLEQKRLMALEDAARAAKVADDALARKAERDKVAREVVEANEKLNQLRSEAGAFAIQISSRRNESASAQTTLDQLAKDRAEAERNKKQLEADIQRMKTEQIALVSQLNADRELGRQASLVADQQKVQRDKLTAELTKRNEELLAIQANLQDMKNQIAINTVNQAAAQQAIRTRNESESEVNKMRGTLSSVSRELSNAQAELARTQVDIQDSMKKLQDIRSTLGKDEAAKKITEAGRIEAEQALERLRQELSGIRNQLIEEQKTLKNLQTETYHLQTLKGTIEANDAAAKAAISARMREQLALDSIKGEGDELRRQLDTDRVKRFGLLREIESLEDRLRTLSVPTPIPTPNSPKN